MSFASVKNELDSELSFALTRPDNQVSEMFCRHGFSPTRIDKAHIVVFPGGADVNPFLYGQRRHPQTRVNYEVDMVDLAAVRQLHSWQARVGICRGGQFLNVMCGGSMYQHVDNHAIHGVHPMFRVDASERPEVVDVTSTHHQMMRPGAFGKVLYAANRSLSKETDTYSNTYTEDNRASLIDDVEVVTYQNMSTLCFQPHPEYDVAGNAGCQETFFELIAEEFLSEEGGIEMWTRTFHNLNLQEARLKKMEESRKKAREKG